MENIINNNALLREIRRIIKQEIPEEKINSLWEFLNQFDERIKVLENEK